MGKGKGRIDVVHSLETSPPSSSSSHEGSSIGKGVGGLYRVSPDSYFKL